MAKTIKPLRFSGKTFTDEVKQFGREVAIYNRGFLAGDDNGRRRGFARALTLVLGDKVKWTNAERRLGNRITRKLFGKKR